MQHRPSISSLLYRLTHGFCRFLFTVIFPCRGKGRQNVPRSGPLLLLSNHQSHLDPIAIAAKCPRRIRCLARETLFVGPFGWFIRSLGAIPVGRVGTTLAGLRETIKLLNQGEAVLVFPEGTRTADGEIGPLKPGFVALVRRKRPLLVPLAIDGSYEAWPKHSRFPRPKRLAIVFSEPISTTDIQHLSDSEFLELVMERLQQCRTEAQQLRGKQPVAGALEKGIN